MRYEVVRAATVREWLLVVWWSKSALVERGLLVGLGRLVRIAVGRRGIGEKLLRLLGPVFVDWRRGIGGVLVGYHSIHHKHGKQQYQQTGDTDGEVQ
jgi:hypothetical protein